MVKNFEKFRHIPFVLRIKKSGPYRIHQVSTFGGKNLSDVALNLNLL